jgi:putative N6-adenine-specific DNA methylase
VVGRSHIFRDTRFVALKVKDAIVDQFTEKFGKRPDVAAKNADLPIHITVNNEKIAIHLDIAGQSLSQRGYRTETGEAPMREHMAAGLLDLSNIDFTKPVVDPMCGSGTLIIEAVARSQGRCFRTSESLKKLSFTRWKNLDADVKQKINVKIDEFLSQKTEAAKNNDSN